MQYQQNMEKEVGVTAHSCVADEPRKLRRFHCRIVQPDGRTMAMDELFPYREAPTGT